MCHNVTIIETTAIGWMISAQPPFVHGIVHGNVTLLEGIWTMIMRSKTNQEVS